MGSFCRSVRIQPCSRSLAPLMAAMGRPRFALPDLRGRTVIGTGSGVTIGSHPGADSHTVTAAELPTAFASSTFQLAAFGPSAGGWSSDDTYPRKLADVD